MLTFFIYVGIGSFFLGVFSEFINCFGKKHTEIADYEERYKMFLFSPEENIKRDRAILLRSRFQTLLLNAALVLLVLLCYWHCL